MVSGFQRDPLPPSIIIGVFIILAAFSFTAMGCQQQQLASRTEQPTDANIEMALRNKLDRARGIPDPQSITIQVDSAVVELTGTIDNILAKERSTRIAESVQGVRSVVNNLVITSQRPDEEIAADVNGALAQDPATDELNVATSVDSAVVTIRGQVDSYQEQELAETVVKGIKGVKGVRDSITVDFALERSDQEIQEDVQSALQWDTRIDAALIDIAVEDNVVILTGTVGSAHEKTLARQKAWVAGVQSVDATDLEVKSWKQQAIRETEEDIQLTDANVKSAIRAALEVDPLVNTDSVDVEVVNGHVTLTGTLDNLKATRSAAQDARNTRGVREVENAIGVGPVRDIPDSRITDQITQSIARDPYLNLENFQVAVQDGIVELSGTAATYFEKWEAGNLAARVHGVRKIENKINVEYTRRAYDQSFHDWDPVMFDFDYQPRQKSDQELLDDVEYQLSWNPFVNSEDLDITVQDGTVTLEGEVDSWYKANMAIREAYEAGAMYVDSKLQYTDIPTF